MKPVAEHDGVKTFSERYIRRCFTIVFAFMIMLGGAGCVWHCAAFVDIDTPRKLDNPYPFKFFVENVQCPGSGDFAGQFLPELIQLYPDFFTDDKNSSCHISFSVDNFGHRAFEWEDMASILMAMTLFIIPMMDNEENSYSLRINTPHSDIQRQDLPVNFKIWSRRNWGLVPFIAPLYGASVSCFGDDHIGIIPQLFASLSPELLSLFPYLIISADKKVIMNCYFISQHGVITLDTGESQ